MKKLMFLIGIAAGVYFLAMKKKMKAEVKFEMSPSGATPPSM